MTPSIRADFPMLAREIDGSRIVYLDSAATSLKPTVTMAAEHAYATEYTANIHRGASALSEEATYRFEAARARIAEFIGAAPGCVVMTPNTSFALAMVAHGVRLTPDDCILCSPNSHHSNLLPWRHRAKAVYVRGDPLAVLDIDEVSRAIKQYRPRVLAFGWVSNVNGAVSPAAEICRVAREHGVISVIDAAQAAPHLSIDVEKVGCDFLAFSGHKMLGPTGTGVLWGRRELLEQLEPLVVGGGTVDRVTLGDYTLRALPHRLEPGTPNIAGVIGLAAAAEYLGGLGLEQVEAHGRDLARAMRNVLAEVRGVRVLMTGEESPQVAIASVVPIDLGMSSEMLCRILSDSFKVMTRSGFHCAHPVFDAHGFELGAVRLSAYIYNSIEDIQAGGYALAEVSRKFASS